MGAFEFFKFVKETKDKVFCTKCKRWVSLQKQHEEWQNCCFTNATHLSSTKEIHRVAETVFY